MSIEKLEEFNFDEIIVEDENGEQHEAMVLTAFREKETNRLFIIYCLPDGIDEDLGQVEVFASIFNEETNEFVEIENDEDWDFVETVLESINESKQRD